MSLSSVLLNIYYIFLQLFRQLGVWWNNNGESLCGLLHPSDIVTLDQELS